MSFVDFSNMEQVEEVDEGHDPRSSKCMRKEVIIADR
jgi:hypothetical protein